MDPQDPATRRLEKIGQEFTVRWLRSEVERRPGNAEALSELANLLTKSGRYEEGLQVDLRLVSLRPEDPIVHYNLACSYALLTKREEALAELRKAVELGYEDRDFILRDGDLGSLHGDPRFRDIVESLGRKPA